MRGKDLIDLIMKKRVIILLSLSCAFLMTAALAAGGPGDPLATLSYLTGTFTNRVNAEVEQRLDESDQTLQNDGVAVRSEETATSGTSAGWTERRMKRGDLLMLSTGAGTMLLAGEGQIAITGGAVVDVTDGREVPSGSVMLVNHRYMAAEDTSATVIITSKTAVLDHQGPCELVWSSEVDYNAMAAALKRLDLFRGTTTGFGQGFDLERAPTRLQALIMFIRVLGEEDQALAWTGVTPFTDVAKGTEAEKYVGYAYEKGYTNGFTATQFRPGNPVNAYQYTEFILRAMGYSSVSNSNLADTLARARIAGVLTQGETEALRADKFLRADLVYISYYALDSLLPDGNATLAQELMEEGVFDEQAWLEAQELVTSRRL